MNLVSVIAEQGLLLVFANVLLQQLGVPIPAEPTLVVAGSLAARGLLPLPGLVGVTWLAVLIADSTWYWMGRRYGNQFCGSSAGWRCPLTRACGPPSRPSPAGA